MLQAQVRNMALVDVFLFQKQDGKITTIRYGDNANHSDGKSCFVRFKKE